jgi:hypothetical protein
MGELLRGVIDPSQCLISRPVPPVSKEFNAADAKFSSVDLRASLGALAQISKP